MDDYSGGLVLELGLVIRMEMAAAGLTQLEVARSAGVHRETLSRYLGGRKDMPLGVLVRVAASLGTEVSTLMLAAEKRLNASPNLSGDRRNPFQPGADLP